MSIIAALAQPAPITVRVRRKAGPGRFHVEDDADLNAPAPASAPAPIGLHGLLALQEAEANYVQDQAAQRRAGSMLAELSALQRALLQDDTTGTARSLARLSGFAHGVVVAHDPRLAAVVRAVAMRAAVEAARHAA